ncbi:MAG TPA: sulfatase-like hydrolase/transferase [Bryobacteraceae bacterium]|nr:sulfatase-like hydrolase/transferase [Bryobacteraceae bacterium]
MSELTRRSVLGAAASAVVTAGRPQPTGGHRPNILFICSDQHSGAALGANGHGLVRTPNLDRLAAGGVNFRNAYCGSPVCVPGRASLMTGKFASDVGSYCNSTPYNGSEGTWGTRLRQAGYDCWATGKMDLWLGRDLGFREVGTSHGHSQNPDVTSLFRAPVCFRPGERDNVDGSFSHRRAPDQPKIDAALAFLRQESKQTGRAWCAYVGLSKPHPKWNAAASYEGMYPPSEMPLPSWPEGYLERRHIAFQILANFKNIQVPISKARIRLARAAYYACISEVDELIGSLLAELERTGQRENTIVVYTSDHGEMLGDHGLWLKNVLLENAVRIPMIVAGPGIPKGRTVETPVSHVDLVATMLDLAGASVASGLRGHSLIPAARGENGSHPGFAYSESHSEGNCTGSFLIRKGDWKYVYFTGGEPLLFNLKEDPGEFRNLAADTKSAGIREELHAHLCSLVDPDSVTRASFRKQQSVLKQLVAGNSRQEFYRRLAGRLGPLQARMITERHYTT